MEGTVQAFDEAGGWGMVEVGEARYPFHCTALVDGTRTVAAGSQVSFEVRAGGMGRWEATRIVKEPAAAAS